MELEIDVRVKVSIPGDLANVLEVCAGLKEVRDNFVKRLGAEVLENYQEVIRDRLCPGKVEKYLRDLVEGVQRCQWHFVRESTLMGWKDGVAKGERMSLRDQLKHIVAIEIPASDIEMVSPEERERLAKRIRIAKRDLSRLATYFEG